jgi:hypothetical protein
MNEYIIYFTCGLACYSIFFTGKTWSTHDGCDVITKGLHAALQRPGSFNLLDEIYSFFSKNSQCSVPDVKQLLSQGP